MATGFSASLLAAATAGRILAGASVAKLAVGLGLVAKMAGRASKEISRVSAAVLLLAGAAKLLSFMTRAARLMSLATIGASLLVGVLSAAVPVLMNFGAQLVGALTLVGAAMGIAAGAAVGLLAPAITVAKIAFKGLGDGAKAFADSMKDVWGPADDALNTLVGQRMAPLLTSFRDLKRTVTDTFSSAMTPAFTSMAGLIDGLMPRMSALSTTIGKLGSDLPAGSLRRKLRRSSTRCSPRPTSSSGRSGRACRTWSPAWSSSRRPRPTRSRVPASVSPTC